MTYEAIKTAIEQAGFFTSHDTDFGRVICAGLRREDGGLTGNSFWIAKRKNAWFLGTWGSHLYRIPEPERIPELCVQWLKQNSQKTAYDVEEPIRKKFDLLEIEDLPE